MVYDFGRVGDILTTLVTMVFIFMNDVVCVQSGFIIFFKVSHKPCMMNKALLYALTIYGFGFLQSLCYFITLVTVMFFAHEYIVCVQSGFIILNFFLHILYICIFAVTIILSILGGLRVQIRLGLAITSQ